MPVISFSQEALIGKIMELDKNGYRVGLAGTNVYWLDTSIGTITDVDGNFSIPYKQRV
jgi:hypothetical protein